MNKYILLAVATVALASCNNDDDDNYIDSAVAAQITATIGRSDLSRASDDKWAAGDKIGVTMGTKYTNIKYTTDKADGVFSGTTMYFMNKTDEVSLSAYYPFSGTEGTAPADIVVSTVAENQTPAKQPAFDFLHATLSASGAEPAVKFQFVHKMSKLTLRFKSGAGADVKNIVSYKIEGLVLEGTFNTVSGDCALKSNTPAAPLGVTLSDVTLTDGELVQSFIILPQTPANKTVRLSITDSEGQDYACTLNFEGNRIASGNNYQFTITVNKTGLTVNESTIAQWTTKASSADADAIDPE